MTSSEEMYTILSYDGIIVTTERPTERKMTLSHGIIHENIVGAKKKNPPPQYSLCRRCYLKRTL